MNFLRDKKAIVTHPVVLFLIGVIGGLILAYLWVKYTTLGNPYC